jgi:hypothetical protein
LLRCPATGLANLADRAPDRRAGYRVITDTRVNALSRREAANQEADFECHLQRAVEIAVVYGHSFCLIVASLRLLNIAGGSVAGEIIHAYAAGFRQSYDWLDERDILIVKSDYQEPLVVVRLSLAAEIAKETA